MHINLIVFLGQIASRYLVSGSWRRYKDSDVVSCESVIQGGGVALCIAPTLFTNKELLSLDALLNIHL